MMLSGWLVVGVALAEPAQVKTGAQPSQTLRPLRTTSIGAVLGWSGSGLALRHYWTPRLGAQLSLYATFGQRFGSYAASTQIQWVLNRDPSVRLYAQVPLRWVYLREPTEQQSNFGPDPRVREVHKLRFGIGPGMEFLVGPQVAFSVELPFVLQAAWVSVRNERSGELEALTPTVAPNVGIHVYFR